MEIDLHAAVGIEYLAVGFVRQSFANQQPVDFGAYRWSVLDVVLGCFSSPAVKKLKRLFPSSSPIPSLVLFYFFISLVF